MESKAIFAETSALTAKNVEEMFIEISESILNFFSREKTHVIYT